MCRTIASHTQATRLQACHTIDNSPRPSVQCPAKQTVVRGTLCRLMRNVLLCCRTHTCCTFPSMMHCHNNLNSKHLRPPMDPRTLSIAAGQTHTKGAGRGSKTETLTLPELVEVGTSFRARFLTTFNVNSTVGCPFFGPRNRIRGAHENQQNTLTQKAATMTHGCAF